jgi:hypothetical protein
MPRKRPSPFFTTVEQHSNPDPRAAPLRALIGGTLLDFDEFATIEPNVRVRLVDDLEEAVRRARVGYRFRRQGVSDRNKAASIFMSDIAASLGRAGIPAARWRKIDDGSGRESLFFRVTRDLASDAGLTLPKDLKVLGQSCLQWKSGVGTGGMK